MSKGTDLLEWEHCHENMGGKHSGPDLIFLGCFMHMVHAACCKRPFRHPERCMVMWSPIRN